ncbi:MAG: hypothetical protein H0V48_10105 [Nocardioidaceae bacterium]|nr:hypothetical protein [Nocardioidaceae bacterium]
MISRRFRGPTSSGNGGYTAGVLAQLVPAADAVEVTLRRPPPLETPLETMRTAAGWVLRDGADAVAEAVAVPTPSDVVPRVDTATARAAEESYRGLRSHPFPECFVCGPRRRPGDGLRLRPGQLDEERTACTWTPDVSLAGDDGRVGGPYVWAALDCPAGWTGDLAGRPMVLGRMTVSLSAAVRAGSTYVVVGQRTGIEGRKTFTASTVYDAGGQPCGRATHTWLQVDPSQFR